MFQALKVIWEAVSLKHGLKIQNMLLKTLLTTSIPGALVFLVGNCGELPPHFPPKTSLLLRTSISPDFPLQPSVPGAKFLYGLPGHSCWS